MDTATWVVSGAVLALAGVVVVLAVAVVRLGRAVAALKTAPTEPPAPAEPARPAEAEFVITRVGEADEPEPRVVSDRIVLSATLGEPLVRAVALAHGVRRALSAQSRNRIGFEVRREVRRSRKARRREMRQAWRASRRPEVQRDVA